MKLTRFITPIIFLLSTSILLIAETDLKVGDSQEDLKVKLGEPAGQIISRDKILFLYPQGEVTVKDELIFQIDLMNEKEFADDQKRLEEERISWQKQEEAARLMRIETGEALKAEKLQSSLFTSLPAKDKVAFWRRFQVKYPEVDISEALARALESYDQDITELKNQQKIAELQAQVARAEKATEEAKLEIEKLRKEIKHSSSNGLRYYTTPVYRDQHYYRPPTIIITSNKSNRTNNTNCAP